MAIAKWIWKGVLLVIAIFYISYKVYQAFVDKAFRDNVDSSFFAWILGCLVPILFFGPKQSYEFIRNLFKALKKYLDHNNISCFVTIFNQRLYFFMFIKQDKKFCEKIYEVSKYTRYLPNQELVSSVPVEHSNVLWNNVSWKDKKHGYENFKNYLEVSGIDPEVIQFYNGLAIHACEYQGQTEIPNYRDNFSQLRQDFNSAKLSVYYSLIDEDLPIESYDLKFIKFIDLNNKEDRLYIKNQIGQHIKKLK